MNWIKNWFLRLVKIKRTFYILVPTRFNGIRRMYPIFSLDPPGQILHNKEDISIIRKFPLSQGTEYTIECRKEDLSYIKLMDSTLQISEKPFRKTMMR